MRSKTKIQLIEKEITQKDGLVRITEELDQNYKSLTGISVLHNIGEHHYFTSFNIDGQEVLPKNFEVAFLQTNAHVAPKDRFFPLEHMADGKKIDIEFQDVYKSSNPIYTIEQSGVSVTGATPRYDINGANEITYPYTLKIYLLLSNA